MHTGYKLLKQQKKRSKIGMHEKATVCYIKLRESKSV